MGNFILRFTAPGLTAVDSGTIEVSPPSGVQTVFTELFPDTNWASRYNDDTLTGNITATVGTPASFGLPALPAGATGNALRCQWGVGNNLGGSLVRFIEPAGYTVAMKWQAYYYVPSALSGNVRFLLLAGSQENSPYSAFTNSAGIVADGLNMYHTKLEKVGASSNFYTKALDAQTGSGGTRFFADGTGFPNCLYPGNRAIPTNQWVKVGLEVCLNSAGASSGTANGWQRYYLNDVAVGEWSAITWRASNNATSGLRHNAIGLEIFTSGGAAGGQQYYIANATCTVDYGVPAGTAAPGFPIAAQTLTAPDLGNTSVTAGNDAWFNYGNAFPGQYATANASAGRSGSRAMQLVISGSSGFNPMGRNFTSGSRRFMRWYVRAATPGVAPGGNVKGMRWKTAGSNQGDVPYSDLSPAFDTEPVSAQGITQPFGVAWGSSGNIGGTPNVLQNVRDIADGNWHCIEVDYNRNDGAFVSCAMWVDGVPCLLPPYNSPGTVGPAQVFGFSSTADGLGYVGGDPRIALPARYRANRNGASTIDGVTFFETISSASGTATIYIDDIAVSSSRIGPCEPGAPGTPPRLYEAWTNAGAALAVGSYASGRWIYTDGSGSEIRLASGGGNIEASGIPASTNAHVQCTAAGMLTSNYGIMSSLRAAQSNAGSELYGYMQAGQNSGYFILLSTTTFGIYRLDNGNPTQLTGLTPAVTAGNWYTVRFDLATSGSTVTLTARLYNVANAGNQYPIVLTTTIPSAPYTSGRVGAGWFYVSGTNNVGVGHIMQTHLLGV